MALRKVGLMYERSYGDKYDRSLSTTEIAKRIRADIKAAVEAGELPGKPVTYSVISRYFSGGSSIDVTARGILGSRVAGEEAERDNRREGKRWPWLTDEARAVMAVLERIHDAYNHNGSEIQVDYFDVNYYGSVEIETEETAAFREREAAKPKKVWPVCEACKKPYRNRSYMAHFVNCEPALAAARARIAERSNA